MIEPSWAVIQTKPAAEEVAERAISEAGYRVYLPRHRVIMRGHRAGGHGKTAPRPLFVGYLFVEVHLGQPEHVMCTASGVCRVLRHAPVDGTRGALKLLSGELVELIREAENSGEFDEAREPGKRGKRNDIKPGDDVRIESGPFASFAAKLVGLDDQGGARLVVSLFGRDTPVGDVDADTLSLVLA